MIGCKWSFGERWILKSLGFWSGNWVYGDVVNREREFGRK